MPFAQFPERVVPKAREQANGSGVSQRPVGPAKVILQRVLADGVDNADCVILGHGGNMTNYLSRVKPNESALRQGTCGSKLLAMSLVDKPFGDIAERIRWHRALEGMEQKEYAQKAGLQRSQLSNWESGDYRLSLDGARALRRTYGLSLDFMFEGIDDALPMTLRVAWRDRPAVK
jgi:ribosome-binding protein aMBF1 (putative translation factor)